MTDLLDALRAETPDAPFAGTAAETHAVYSWIEDNTLGSFEPLSVIVRG
jgi:hypothetical protein